MSYLVLARKCRPSRFDEVVGQNHVTKTLANAIKMNRVAHGFLFSGVRGVGKTSLARILAKSLNCSEGPTDTPCGECDSCKAIASGTAVDVIEIDGASNNSVEDVRELRETVPYRPVLGRFKIYVIDEVHMLSVSAFNALLKTLEEPPPHVKFIFATTEPHKIPMTILSRVQRYDFRRIPTSAITTRIGEILADEGIKAEDGAIAIVGREAEGSMRDALSILDQVLAAGAQTITAEDVADLLGVVARKVYYDISGAILEHDPKRCLEVIRDVDRQGFDLATFTRGLLEHFRNLIVAGVCKNDLNLLDLPQEEIDDLVSQSSSTTTDTLHRLFKHLSDAYDEIARSAFPKILLEATLARMADLGDIVPAQQLLRRLETLAKSGHTHISREPSGSSNPPLPPLSEDPGSSSISGTVNQGQSAGAVNVAPRPAPFAPKPVPETVNNAKLTQAMPPPVASQKTQAPVSKPSPAAAQSESQPLTETKWKELLGEIAATMPAKFSIVERAVPASNSTLQKITLQFDTSDAFAASRAKDPEVKLDIERFLSKHIGLQVYIEVDIRDLGKTSTLAKQRLETHERHRQAEESARNHPVVRGFQSALGGKISQIRLNNDSRNI